MMELTFKQIAHVENAYTTKFGIPRQAGLAEKTESKIVFESQYKNPDAIRGIEGFSYIWVLWVFSESITEEFQPMVRPPRLGGNTKMGVFATRAPFRPNPIGLSCVKLLRIEDGDLIVSGADMMNGTPIVDIKPYIPYADMKEDATEGYATCPSEKFKVEFSCEVEEDLKEKLIEILSLDPRPHYLEDGNRIYGMTYGNLDIHFVVDNDTIEVTDIICLENNDDIT